jgi:spectinomycin phosphotransferase
MQRSELALSDQEIIGLVAKVWGFTAQTINYIEFGSTFSFCLANAADEKVFLKVYRKTRVAAHLYNSTSELLQHNCSILDRLHNNHKLAQIPQVIKTNAADYLYEFHGFMLVVCQHIEGSHPKPTQLQHAKLATILSNLHAVPVAAFADVAAESYNIDFALGFKAWLKVGDGDEKIRPMLAKIAAERAAIEALILLQERFVAKPPSELVLTHGDAHRFNVLQTSNNLYLIDWDDLMVGPRERDLWHYEDAQVMADYAKLNPSFSLNHELCLFYRLQRFLDDLRIYIEQPTITDEQAKINSNYFCNHQSWQECKDQAKVKGLSR